MPSISAPFRPSSTPKIIATQVQHYFSRPPSPTTTNTMVVKIRLARFGRRKAPFYNIVVAQARYLPSSFSPNLPLLIPPIHPPFHTTIPSLSLFPVSIQKLTQEENRTARNSKPIEVLGTYDPIPKAPTDGEGKPFKDIKLDTARAKYWLGVGAQPSDPAWRLLSMVSLCFIGFAVREGSGGRMDGEGGDGRKRRE